VLHWIAGVLGSLVCVVALWALAVDDPLGGEPAAVVAITAAPAPKIVHAMPTEAPDAGPGPRRYDVPPSGGPDQARPPAAAGMPSQTITIIDGSTGKREVVVIASPQTNAAPAPDGAPRRSSPGSLR
jgi:hypothetical protein